MSTDPFLPRFNFRVALPVCGKFVYADKKAALSQINRRMEGRQGHRHGRPEFLRAYCCNKCGGWHITHRQ